MTARAAVILAAGQGTRMKSPIPKMLHKVGGRTLLDRVIDTVLETGCERVVVVVNAGRNSWQACEYGVWVGGSGVMEEVYSSQVGLGLVVG
jgi:bifunctional N-acetylglucosamine-1-phosphate-uridyltransferase/glucosamine-1-phosphate-acetyltransferase GlmU-like protein